MPYILIGVSGKPFRFSLSESKLFRLVAGKRRELFVTKQNFCAGLWFY